MKAFNVYTPDNNGLQYRLIDTVYFIDQCDAEYVKFSLINHDDYSNDIEVEEVK